MLTLDMLPWAMVACVVARLVYSAAANVRLQSQLSLARDELVDARARIRDLEAAAVAARDAAIVKGGDGLQDLVNEIVTTLQSERSAQVHTDVTIS